MKPLILAVGAALVLASGARAAPDPALVDHGQALFHHTCLICHAKGATAANVLAKRLGPEKSILAERTNLTPAYVRNVVRRGIGSMPWMTKVEVTDSDLAAIAAYLTRNNPAAGR